MYSWTRVEQFSLPFRGSTKSGEGDQTAKGFSEVGLGEGDDELFLTCDLFFNLDLSFLGGFFLDLSCLYRLLPWRHGPSSLPVLWHFPLRPLFLESSPSLVTQAGAWCCWFRQPLTSGAEAPPAAQFCRDHWAEVHFGAWLGSHSLGRKLSGKHTVKTNFSVVPRPALCCVLWRTL